MYSFVVPAVGDDGDDVVVVVVPVVDDGDDVVIVVVPVVDDGDDVVVVVVVVSVVLVVVVVLWGLFFIMLLKYYLYIRSGTNDHKYCLFACFIFKITANEDKIFQWQWGKLLFTNVVTQ